MKLLLPSYALCNMSVQVMYHILALVSHVPSKIVHFTPLSTQVLRSLKFFLRLSLNSQLFWVPLLLFVSLPQMVHLLLHLGTAKLPISISNHTSTFDCHVIETFRTSYHRLF
jgi:hypothetical protein